MENEELKDIKTENETPCDKEEPKMRLEKAGRAGKSTR